MHSPALLPPFLEGAASLETALSCPKGAALPAPRGRTGAGLSRVLSCPALSPGSWLTPFGSPDMKATPEEESHTRCWAETPPPPASTPAPRLRARSPKLPVQRQLWVRGWGLVWWLSRICCTSCSTEKPELLFPLLQVHLMPWTMGRERQRGGQRSRGAGAGPGRAGTWALSEHSSLSAGRLAQGGN